MTLAPTEEEWEDLEESKIRPEWGEGQGEEGAGPALWIQLFLCHLYVFLLSFPVVLSSFWQIWGAGPH